MLLHILCMLNHAYEAWKLTLPDEPPNAGTHASKRVAQYFCSMKDDSTKAVGLNNGIAINRHIPPKPILHLDCSSVALGILVRLLQGNRR
jgi:hypothetical protein